MQSGFDIDHLVREAQTRWLKPVEVHFILQNYDERQITHQIPQQPGGGSLYLFNKRVLKFFRKDGHKWRKRRDQKTTAEAHERLKVGNVEMLNCYYAHGEENHNFQRRSYWILEPAYEHIVLVHYRETSEGRQNSRSTSQFSTLSSSTFSPSITSTHQPDSSVGGFHEPYHNESSPSSVEISSREAHGYLEPDLSQAETLRRIAHHLSLNDDDVKEMPPFLIENEDSNDLEDALRSYGFSSQTSTNSDNLLSREHTGTRQSIRELGIEPEGLPGGHDFSDGGIQQDYQLPGVEANLWSEMLNSSKSLPDVESVAQFNGQSPQTSSMMIPQEVDPMQYPVYTPELNAYGINSDFYPTLFDQDHPATSLEENMSLTITQKQKFTIREISPEWCYTSEPAKIVIIGSFLCDPSKGSWACMFGDTEVPVQLIQEGVFLCHAPPHLHGRVTLCITSGNRESCSEIREFEYREKPNPDPYFNAQHNRTDTEANKSSEELLLLVRFVQILLSNLSDGPGLRSGKSRVADDSWSQIFDSLLFGNPKPSSILDWLMQELLKDKFDTWISSRLQTKNENKCCLSKKEQGIVHLATGLGFEWALQPILNSGVSVNFRDINGWTALHWAARFGREKMVASLIASGASAGAVTDPTSQDPTGTTAASIAATCGHKGLAGYLSEVSLTSHLSSLTMHETELSKGSAALEAERTVNTLSTSINEDQVSLKYTLAAVRSAAQAAARIQSAFRAHSFRKRQQRGVVEDSEDEYSLLESDIRGLSAASKLAFRNVGDHNFAALSIQKKYRGWKGRKEFLAFRQKVVRIQAHVRGYQVRKNYKVCWAVGILEKVVLRWRRRGVGLRGFRHDSESIDEIEDDEDILKVFRKQKVEAAIDEAVSRVLSMVESSEARKQYHRILEKYRQAKAELASADSSDPSSSHPTISYGIPHVET